MPLQKIVVLATLAAFLAFMASKLENTRNINKLTPNGPKNMKKLSTFHDLAFWPLERPSWPLLAFFGCYEILEGL